MQSRCKYQNKGDKGLSEFEKAGVAIKNGTPLDKLRAEIEQTEINGYIRDIECFSAGINVALNVIDKYRKGANEK